MRKGGVRNHAAVCLIGVCWVLLGCSKEEESSSAQAQLAEDSPKSEVAPPKDALEASIRRRAPEEAPYMVVQDQALRGDLDAGQSATHSLIVQAGACYKVLAAGGKGVIDLDLLVFDDDLVLTQRDLTRGAHPVVGAVDAICPAESGAYRLQVRMKEGKGRYVAQVYTSQ